MSINLVDGPILLKCEFTRNITERTKVNEPVNIHIDHEIKTIVSDDVKEAQIVYSVKCTTESSTFLFSIDYGCKFKIEGFKNPQDAHAEVSQKGMIILQIAIREFLADLTRRAGQSPLLMPLVELEISKPKTIGKTPAKKKSKR